MTARSCTIAMSMTSVALKHVSSLQPILRAVPLTLRQVITPTTLQQAQTDALFALLSLADAPDAPIQPKSAPAVKTPSSTAPLVWKVLVLDQQTKDVLATVLRVQDLRDAGVTLHVYAVSFSLSSSSSHHTASYTRNVRHCRMFPPSTLSPRL